MARRQEPGWLTVLFTVFGFVVIVAAVFIIYLFVNYWPLFLLFGIGAAALYWYTASPAAKERQARQRTAELLRALAALDFDFPLTQTFSADVLQAVLTRVGDATPCPAILSAFTQIAEELYIAEEFTLTGIVEPPALLDTIEGARYREKLVRQRAKLADATAFETTRQTLIDIFVEIAKGLPPVARQSAAETTPGRDNATPIAAFSVPLIDILPDVGKQVEEVIFGFYAQKARSRELFADLRNQLDRNHCLASGLPDTRDSRDSSKLILPSAHDGTPAEIVSGYLADTPLLELFKATVPFTIPEQTRFEHTHILAGSGHGKTQTLQHLLVSDLRQENHPSLIVIDSQGDMLRKISHMALFDPDGGTLASKLIIIDPSDVEYPPALNMFDVNFERLGKYGAAAREQILNGVIELYDYIFGSLLGAELTQKQSVIFRYLARLMLTIPGATIHTLIELMNDATPFQKNIEQLLPGARMFFETEFPHKSFTDTKRQIQRRLWGILENPTFERMLTAPKNRIDMFDALNTGKIVLVNTAKDFLKAERSSFLGRFFIALTLQAALERAALPEGKRRLAFLYIDEAADYFDTNIDDLLTQARKYNLGVIFSHQYLDQLAPGLRSSIASNTSIKLAGGISDRDARSLAPDMRTTPTFLLQQRKSVKATQFACYLRNITPHALSLSVPFGTLEAQATMSPNAFGCLQNENRARVSVSGSTESVQQPASGRSHPQPLPEHAIASTARPDDDWSG